MNFATVYLRIDSYALCASARLPCLAVFLCSIRVITELQIAQQHAHQFIFATLLKIGRWLIYDQPVGKMLYGMNDKIRLYLPVCLLYIWSPVQAVCDFRNQELLGLTGLLPQVNWQQAFFI